RLGGLFLPPGLSLALRSGAVQTGAPARQSSTPGSSHGSRTYLTVVVSPVGGGGQVHQPVVGGEQPPDQAQRDHRGGGGGGGKDQEHHDGLDQDGLQGSGTGQDEPGHGAREEHQAGGFGGFDLRGERRPQGRAHVGGGGQAGGLAQRQAGFDLVAFVAQF